MQYQELGREAPQEEPKPEPELEEGQDPAQLRQKLQMPIDRLGLTVRASNCLDTQGIRSVGELVVRTEAELLAMRNLGKTSLEDIKTKLGSLGLAVGMQIDQAIIEGIE